VTETKVRVGHVPRVLRTRPALDTDDPEDDAWTEESALTLTDDGYEVSDAPRLDPDYARDFATGLGDVSGLPEPLITLRAGGYDEPASNKRARGNWIRVLRAARHE
jgi:microsomal dipeptidase-like Zn-dependent dipeptidase